MIGHLEEETANMPLVGEDVVDEIFQTAKTVPEIHKARTTLLHQDALGAIEVQSVPDVQLMVDIRWCNGNKLAGEPYPLRFWLNKAALMYGSLAQGVVFRKLLDTVKSATLASDTASDFAQYFNRRDQMDAIEEMLDERADLSARPVAFLLSGADAELHDGFHERLAKNPPRALGCASNAASQMWCPELPRSPGKDADTTTRSILRRIETELGIDKWDNEALPPGLTYIRFRVDAEGELDGKSGAVVDALLAALSNPALFPDIPKGRALCVGVSVAWEGAGPGRDQLEARFRTDLYPALRFRVLPDLASPHRNDANRWVDVVGRMKRGGLALAAREALVQRARAAFGSRDQLPMRDLYDELRKVAA
jgi:hypothetical protein